MTSPITLSAEFRKLLIEAGATCQWPEFIPRLNDSFSVEAPCVIQGEIRYDTFVQLGAFTGVFGTVLRNVSIGRYCSVAGGVQMGWSEHPTHGLTSSMMAYVPDVHGWASCLGLADQRFCQESALRPALRGATIVGHDVWIGHSAIIRSGVTVGTGSIVGAGAVVTKDVEPYSIVAGNPARLIRKRFGADVIERLLLSQWWNYSLYDFPPQLLHDPVSVLDWIEDAIRGDRIRTFSGIKITNNVLSGVSAIQK